jgi:hypothetical protein
MNISPADLDTAAVMDLESDTAPSLADFGVGEISHGLAIEEGLDAVSFCDNSHCIPLSFFKDVLFLVRDSPKPSLKALTFRKVSGMLFWSVIYLYSLLGILSLGIARVYPVYLLMGVAAYLVSLLLCLAGKD